jgi:hypothetical protein
MDLFSDSIDTMELDSIKQKISDLYNKMLEAYYKKANPGHNDLELEDFMESNALGFEGAEEEMDEMDELVSMLEDMLDDGEELEPVDSSGNAPDYKGQELRNKSNDKGTTPLGTYRGLPTGGMLTPADSQTKVRTTKEEDPTGSINRKNIDEVMVQYAPLVEKLKEELASLKQRKRIGIKEFRLG